MVLEIKNHYYYMYAVQVSIQSLHNYTEWFKNAWIFICFARIESGKIKISLNPFAVFAENWSDA